MTETRFRLGVSGAGLLLVLGLVAATVTTPLAASPLAQATVYPGGIDFLASVSYSRAIVTVSGGEVNFKQVFEEGDAPSIGLLDPDGYVLPDGVYRWQLELVPDAATARTLRMRTTANGGVTPGAWERLSGTMTIRNGLLALPDLPESGEVAHTALDSGLSPSSSFGSSAFARTSLADDSDAMAGSRVDAEERAQTAAAGMSGPAGFMPGDRTAPERSDLGATAMGGSLEDAFAARASERASGGAKPAPRSIDPEGKNGRPRSRDELDELR